MRRGPFVRVLALTAAVGIGLAPGVARAEHTRSETHPYVGGAHYVGVATIGIGCLRNLDPGLPDEGNEVCTKLKGGELEVAITLTDDMGWLVGATVEFWGSTYIGETGFCGSATVEIPTAADRLQIEIDGPPSLRCLDTYSPGFGTKGSVGLVFLLDHPS